MKVLKARQIVVEIERVQTIRKQALTQVAVCRQCGAESDFMPIADAAALFETETETLLTFISDHRCHFDTNEDGLIFLCFASLLEIMRIRSGADDRPQLSP